MNKRIRIQKKKKNYIQDNWMTLQLKRKNTHIYKYIFIKYVTEPHDNVTTK